MPASPWTGEGDPDDLPGMRGFKVPRNGCFGAATLQCLCRLKYFDNIDDDNLNDVVSVFGRMCQDINADTLYDTPVQMKELWDALRKSVKSNEQLRSMFDGQQMDAEEFLRHMMDLLSDDERTQNIGLFDSTTMHFKACVHPACPHRKSRLFGPEEHESSMILKLPIVREGKVDDGRSLRTIGKLMEAEYAVELNPNFDCEVCKYGITSAENELGPWDVSPRQNPGGMYMMRKINTWPDVLVIHVVRNNTHEERFDTRMKIEPMVQFKTAPGVYELVSYVDHRGGNSANNGHYVAHCKVGDTWVEFDDDKASPQRELDKISTSNTLMFYKLLVNNRG